MVHKQCAVSRHWLAACCLLLPLAASAGPVESRVAEALQLNKPRNEASPLIIAHRGASGYLPEHTLAAYAVAILQGADYIEPDLVMTRDGHLIARHDNHLGLTTDVAQRPEFAARKRTQQIDGSSQTGWFSEDFDLAEIKQLRAIERIPELRPGNRHLDGAFEVPTLEEIIALVQAMQASENRMIGLYPETKHPTHFREIGLAMEKPLVRILHRNGYLTAHAPVYIQSFEVDNLKILKRLTKLRLVQLFGTGQPYDQQFAGHSLTYAQMATPEGLRAIAGYAQGVGPEKSYIIPRDADGSLGTPTRFVANAHAAGLKVHPYTFRAENAFLPSELRSSDDPAARGDLPAEIRAFLEAGVDGLFIDQPDIAVRLRF